MAVYIGILTASSVFSFCYSKSRDKSAQVVFITLCFLSLFVPAAVRYGIGIDYVNYALLFNKIAAEKEVSQEVGFVFICKFLQFLHLSYHFLFVAFSFFTLFFVFVSVPKRYFYTGIPCYVLAVHFMSYSAIRQELACAIFLFACKFFFDKKYILYLFWCVIAILNHTSALLLAVLLSFFQLLPLLSAKKYLALYIGAFVFFHITKNTLIDFIMTKILAFTPYAKYALNAYASHETEMGSGMGLFLKLVILAVFLSLVLDSSISNKKKKFCIGFVFSMLAARELSTVLYIFMRLVVVMGIVHVNLAVLSCQSKNPLKKIWLAFVYMLLFVLFIKDIFSSTIRPELRFSGKQIYPYVSIFNWRDNPIILRRMSRF